MYYLNFAESHFQLYVFLRTKFICIIWTFERFARLKMCSWGLSLFVLFERHICNIYLVHCSWGLSLFVLFEQCFSHFINIVSSWGLSLFVLFEQVQNGTSVYISSWGLSLFVLFEHPFQFVICFIVLED